MKARYLPFFFRHDSPTASCIQRKKDQTENVLELLDLEDCLINVRRSDIQVTYTKSLDGKSESSYTFGWNEPLKMDGNVVQEEIDFPRYENAFAKVGWGEKLFNITSQNHSLVMDFQTMEMYEIKKAQ